MRKALQDTLPSIPSPQGRGSKYPHKMRKNQIKDPHSYAMTQKTKGDLEYPDWYCISKCIYLLIMSDNIAKVVQR